jgi:hypothetical protein
MLLGLTACGGGNATSNNNKAASAVPVKTVSATATNAAPTAVSAAPSAAVASGQAPSSGSPARATPPASPQPLGPAAASTGVADQVEQRLAAALIGAGDAPSNLTVAGLRGPFNNQQYAQLAAGGGDAATVQKAQSDAGRISGALASFSSPDAANPPKAASEITNLLIILSAYGSPGQASAAMPGQIKSFTPSISNASALSVTKQAVSLGTIADETTAESIKASPILGDQSNALTFWVVGVRRGAVVELYIETGVGDAPSSTQVLETINRQDASVAKAGF